MLSRSIALALHEHPRSYRAAARMWELTMAALPARSVPGIPGRVHRADRMLESSRDPVVIARYVEGGLAAVQLIEAASQDLASAAPLDLGCGYGRVVRWLARRIDPDRITVTDLDSSAVAFCRAEFGVRGFVCSADPASLLVTGNHDVVWMGSVISHLSRPAAVALLDAVSHIITGGAAVIVTQHSPSQVPAFVEMMPWVERHSAAIYEQLASEGWAYVDYPHHGSGYGLAFATDEAMRVLAAAAGMQVQEIRQGGWLEQDVWVLRSGAQRGSATALLTPS